MKWVLAYLLIGNLIAMTIILAMDRRPTALGAGVIEMALFQVVAVIWPIVVISLIANGPPQLSGGLPGACDA